MDRYVHDPQTSNILVLTLGSEESDAKHAPFLADNAPGCDVLGWEAEAAASTNKMTQGRGC